MFLLNALARWRRGPSPADRRDKQAACPGEDALARLHTVEQLQRILVRERARADRTGDRFAVVAFAPRERQGARATWHCLARIFGERLRLTDDAGWLDEQRLAAVLPGTDAAGAWTVADELCRRFPEEIPPPLCTVYSYSGDRPQRGTQNSERGTTEVPRSEEPASQNGSEVPQRRRTAPLESFFVQRTPLWKRLLDVVGASLGLVLLAPVFAVIAGAIKLTSPGPVFFGQWRNGRGGKPFVMWKFRSMVADAESRKQDLLALNEQDGPAFKIKRDPRITRVGRFLRATSLDELPQLWNVLKGEMSLVGPRPMDCAETVHCASWQRQRLDVTPGLTCIWQVRGRSAVSFATWMRMDIRYIRSRSLWQDLKLLLQTVPVVLLRRGV
jgi:lipopolysaccharide/colanic/teichoic acid biosynthesis glycosyltransferase